MGSTSIGIMERINADFDRQQRKHAVVVPADARTDCLLQLQEGMVDAYLGHDTFMTGMIDQNQRLRMVLQGDEQPYGIAISKRDDHTYFVRYVNAVLAEMRESGELQALLDGAQKSLPPLYPTRPLP
jgi:ABC-type amino acid transport substrate-binding protein